MGVLEIIKEALRIARKHKSLWLFGFLVGIGGGFDFGGGGGQEATPPVAATPPEPATVLLVVLGGVAAVVGFVILKFLSTGALIEGVRRVRGNGTLTVREGFREGWAHWGVLFRLTLIYLPINLVSVAVLAAPCALVFRAFGSPAVFVACGVAVLVGVPWLLTLYMWQAFAERIAVLENRRALDAVRKARLFLHGRLKLALKLFVANFLGVLFVSVLGALVVIPVVLLIRLGVVSIPELSLPVFALGVLTILPAAFVAIAFVGIITSSVWTIGYLTQVER